MRARDLGLLLGLWCGLVLAPAVIAADVLQAGGDGGTTVWIGLVGYLVQFGVFMLIARRANVGSFIGWFVPSLLPWVAIWSVPGALWRLAPCALVAIAFAYWIYWSSARSQRLQHDGIPARGVVLEVLKPLMNVVINNVYIKRTLRLRIERFDGASPYEAKYRGTFMIGNIPAVGDTLTLRIDPNKPSHFEVADDADVPAAASSSAYSSFDSFGGGDIADQLREVTELHRSGALTDEEFDAAKRRILGG